MPGRSLRVPEPQSERYGGLEQIRGDLLILFRRGSRYGIRVHVLTRSGGSPEGVRTARWVAKSVADSASGRSPSRQAALCTVGQC